MLKRPCLAHGHVTVTLQTAPDVVLWEEIYRTCWCRCMFCTKKEGLAGVPWARLAHACPSAVPCAMAFPGLTLPPLLHPPLPAVPGNGLLLLAPSSWARWQSRSIQQSNGLSETSRLPSDLSTGKHGVPTASPTARAGTARPATGLRSARVVLPSAFPPPALPVAAQTFHAAESICKAQAGAASLHACEPAPP